MAKRIKIVEESEKQRLEVMLGLVLLLYLIFLEIIAISIAVIFHNYLLLSCITYVWVLLITENYIKKYLFKELDNFLIKTPKRTGLVFFISFVITATFSWKYFTSFILCIIQAFMYGEFCRLKRKKQIKKSSN